MKWVLPCFMLLAACSTVPPKQEPVVDIRMVNKPIAVPCAADAGVRPDFADSREALLAVPFPGAEARLQANPNDSEALAQVSQNLAYDAALLASAWPGKNAWIGTLEAALSGCVKLKAPP